VDAKGRITVLKVPRLQSGLTPGSQIPLREAGGGPHGIAAPVLTCRPRGARQGPLRRIAIEPIHGGRLYFAIDQENGR
jgi:hypothetical protein